MNEQTELSVIPLEQKVEQEFKLEIVKLIPDPEAAIAKLKENYMTIKVTDKASFKKADEGRKDVKNFRVMGEKVCDAQRADLEVKKKAWIKKKEDWGDTLGEIEDYLIAETEKWKQAEQKRKDEEAEKLEAEKKRLDLRLLERQQELGKLSVLFSDNTFMLGEVRYSYEKVREADDEVYQNEINPAFKAIYDQHEEERRQQEIERQEADEKQRQEQEQLRQEQQQLKREQDEMKQQRFELRKDRLISLGMKIAWGIDDNDTHFYVEGDSDIQLPISNLKEWNNDQFQGSYKIISERMDAAKQAKEQRKERERIAEHKRIMFNDRFVELDGAKYNEATETIYAYTGDALCSKTTLADMPQDEWDLLVKNHNQHYAESQAEAERKRQEEEEQKRVEAEKQALHRSRVQMLSLIGIAHPASEFLGDIGDDTWEATYRELKTQYDNRKHEEWLEQERIKKIQEQEREQERQAELTEGERWRQWKDKLQKFAADMPSFTNKRYSKMKAIAQEKFAEIQQLRADKISNN